MLEGIIESVSFAVFFAASIFSGIALRERAYLFTALGVVVAAIAGSFALVALRHL